MHIVKEEGYNKSELIGNQRRLEKNKINPTWWVELKDYLIGWATRPTKFLGNISDPYLEAIVDSINPGRKIGHLARERTLRNQMQKIKPQDPINLSLISKI